jgi:hypothetical protein
MGRTVPSFRMTLENAIKKWDGYRRALGIVTGRRSTG